MSYRVCQVLDGGYDLSLLCLPNLFHFNHALMSSLNISTGILHFIVPLHRFAGMIQFLVDNHHFLRLQSVLTF